MSSWPVDSAPLNNNNGVSPNNNNNSQHGILHMLYFQYNYNPQTVLTVRDRLCHALFVKLSHCYSVSVPIKARKALEYGLLAMAVLCFLTLSYMHVAFVKSPIRCLDSVSHQWPQQGVLRVEIVRSKDLQSGEYSLERSYLKELAIQHNLGASHFNMADVERIIGEEAEENSSGPEKPYFSTVSKAWPGSSPSSPPKPRTNYSSIPRDLVGLGNRSVLLSSLEGNHSEAQELKFALEEFEKFRKDIWPNDEYIVEYSLDYGMLRLSPPNRNKLNVPVHFVTLNPEKDACFGDGVSRFVLRYLVGYNDLLMGSLKRLAEREDNKGYVRNVVSGEHFRFISMWATRTSYVTAGIVMVVFTLSISMLMRYTHHQIFALIVEVLHLLEFNSGRSFRTAPLFTVILALVGMEAIMSEFFNDSTTAFGIIFVVWLADHFDAVCCHTSISKRHWPRFFFLYHFAFYAYDYRFNGQYSGLALLTSFFFMLHSMIYFYHRFELPAIPSGQGETERIGVATEEASPEAAPRQHSPPQQTQFVISARVTVTRRIAESTPPASETVERVSSVRDSSSREASPERRSEHIESPETQENNRTRKLSTSSAEASSCGCCSSNDTSDRE